MDRTKLTQAELGAALGISQPMTSRLIALGMPDDSIEAARLWRKAHLDRSYTIDYRRTRHPRHAAVREAAQAAMQADPPAKSWRDRHDRARARTAEIELALLEGRSLDRDQTMAVLTAQIANMRQRLLSIPSRVVLDVPAEARLKVVEIIEREVFAALAEISGIK